jgi:hypothetical protein
MPKTSGSGLVRVGVDVGREDRLMTTVCLMQESDEPTGGSTTEKC